ncbi:hypothetical protein HI113_03715 [Corallococcus exiguus]|uniref:hypothetical protein n=1 Tax=Corallococcus exiguus TaxID=83462 RepID=UPI001475C2C5|nr:hypothetical protein [Corallococcus exiguus]NNB93019.1 hypothetical protein [Corallococcus exiguus]
MKVGFESLPELNKKVVYLDQFVISNMTKALNPQAPGHEKARQNPNWIEMYKLLDVLVRGQVLVCPHFENHRTESMYSRFYPALKWLYDYLSGGVELFGSEQAKRNQLAEAARAWVERREPAFDTPANRSLHGSLNAWIDRIRITTKGQYPDDIDDLRKVREQGHSNLIKVFERWQTEKNRRFEDWHEEERREFGKAYIGIYHDWVRSYVRVSLGHDPFSLQATWPPEAVTTINLLADLLNRHGVPEQESLSRAIEFIGSDAPLEIPYLRISAALWATIAMKASLGQKTPPNQGTFADVNAVATVLPVCDAIVIDDKCAALLRDTPKKYRPNYPARVFSTQNIPKFIEYLRQLKDSISESHIQQLQKVYGDNWDQPNLKLFTNQ